MKSPVEALENAFDLTDPLAPSSVAFSTASSSQSTSLAISNRNISRDEMNLAEFPLALLSNKQAGSVKTLEFKDTITKKNGQQLERRWIITGADKFGLPTASDDEVILGLLKLTAEQGFKERKIFFTRYELLTILRWSTEGRSYQRLQKALDRLSGVRIKASNAFFDNESKAHSTKNFGIIDAYELNDGRGGETKPSYFVWSETIFKSFSVGFIKRIDLDFVLTLTSAVAKRVYRYLDKHFWYRSVIEHDLFTFCHEKIGVSRTFKHVSSLKQQLSEALDELCEKNFLAKYEIEGKGSRGVIRFFAASKSNRVQAEKNSFEKDVTPEPKPTQVVFGHGAKPSSAEKSPIAPLSENESLALQYARGNMDELTQQLEHNLVERGIRPEQARKLLISQSPQNLSRMEAILKHFDMLVATKSKHISRSPIGFLYRAMENPEKFILPGEGRSGAPTSPPSGSSRTASSQQTRFVPASSVPRASGKQVSALSERALADLHAQYLVERRACASRARATLPAAELAQLKKGVEDALKNIRSLISEDRFRTSIDHALDEKLLNRSSFPNFEEWQKAWRKKA